MNPGNDNYTALQGALVGAGVCALAPTTITVPHEVTAVHDLEGHALAVHPGEQLKASGQPVYLSR